MESELNHFVTDAIPIVLYAAGTVYIIAIISKITLL